MGHGMGRRLGKARDVNMRVITVTLVGRARLVTGILGNAPLIKRVISLAYKASDLANLLSE